MAPTWRAMCSPVLSSSMESSKRAPPERSGGRGANPHNLPGAVPASNFAVVSGGRSWLPRLLNGKAVVIEPDALEIGDALNPVKAWQSLQDAFEADDIGGRVRCNGFGILVHVQVGLGVNLFLLVKKS